MHHQPDEHLEQPDPIMEVVSTQHPDKWFIQVEVNFARSRINSDRTKVDLLENLSLDDRRPSDLLREKREVAGDDVSQVFF